MIRSDAEAQDSSAGGAWGSADVAGEEEKHNSAAAGEASGIAVAGLEGARSPECQAAVGRTWSGLREGTWEEVGSSAAAAAEVLRGFILSAYPTDQRAMAREGKSKEVFAYLLTRLDYGVLFQCKLFIYT